MITYTPGSMRIPLLKSQFKNEATLQLYQRKASRKTGRTEEQAGLSDRDKVLIRDTWNKFQAHQEVGLEAFVERVFYESPATESRMGVLGDEVEEIIFGLFDLCIRSLHPHTENLGREAAMPAHADKNIQWKTIEDYASWFAEIEIREHDWRVIGRVWLWALQELFILEELERNELRKGQHSAFYRFYQEYIMEPMRKAILATFDPIEKNVILGVDLLDRHDQRIHNKAKKWLKVMAHEQKWDAKRLQDRLDEIEEELLETGTYQHTLDEIEYGAQVAWRNAVKCIGRVHWNNLIVRDCRHITEPDAMYQELLEHLRLSTGDGNIQTVITVFRNKEPHERWGPRIWNTQLIRYAGYRQPDGSILGDPDNTKYTERLITMGWKPPEVRGEFDILPLVIDLPGYEPRMYKIPSEYIAEVPIEHPDIPGIAELNLKWYAVPAICNIGLDLGGLRYTCTPFNGWFMGTEIARDLLDEHRYNKAEALAHAMGLDTSSEQTMWRDRVHLELNYAILQSFQKHRITLVDHHTASRQFLIHDRREKQAGRECPARWSWIIPPMSSSACPVFHHEMREFVLEPLYRNMYNRWEVLDADTSFPDVDVTEHYEYINILILFGSESGTAENYSYHAARRFKRLHPEVMPLSKCTPADLDSTDLLLVITSTFGEGDLPRNAQHFADWLHHQPANFLKGLPYGVFGIGSSIYENFCAAGIQINQLLADKGAIRLLPLHKGDELFNQSQRLHTWLERIARILDLENTLAKLEDANLKVTFLEKPPTVRPVRQGEEVYARLHQNQELLQNEQNSQRSTRFLAFDVDEHKLAYEAGDHIAVFPMNPPDLAMNVCKHIGVAPHAWFSVEGEKVPYPLPSTPYKVLREELDLCLQGPSEGLLQTLQKTATCPNEQQELARLLKQSSQNENPLHLGQQYANLLELLQDFPSAQMTFASLLSLLPQQKARFYSIASSPLLHPKQVNLTVSLAHVPVKGGHRPGLCSNYLANLSVGEYARIFRSPSKFRLPKEPSSPMFWVGPGAGISPFLGFLEQREALWKQSGSSTPQEAGLGPVWLFFGCRNHDDFLYQSRLETWLKQGIISRMDVAFSRLSKQKKTYVQHLMKQNSNDVWQFLSQPNCHYYVCGDAKMADDTLLALQQIFEGKGRNSPEQAKSFFSTMKQEKRWFTDVWSPNRS